VALLCPEAPPGPSLAISVEVGQRVSNTIQSVMAEAAPGLLDVDGSGKGQGFALHDGVLSALASFRAAGSPTLGGGRLSFYSTGITCGQNFVTKTPLLHFGHDYADIATIRPSGFPGVCEVQTVVPYGVSGDAVQVYLEWVDAAGAATRSNTISVAVDQ